MARSGPKPRISLTQKVLKSMFTHFKCVRYNTEVLREANAEIALRSLCMQKLPPEIKFQRVMVDKGKVSGRDTVAAEARDDHES